MDGHALRDHHLFGPGPERILSLDGGGVRGVIAVAFLERIEAALAGRAATEATLSDHFDLIGGTSTGAIIATGLALGKTTTELKDIYQRLAPRAFQRSRFRIPFLQPKFDVAALRREISAIVGDETLDTEGAAHWARHRGEARRHREPVDPRQQSPRALLGRSARWKLYRKTSSTSSPTCCVPARRRRPISAA